MATLERGNLFQPELVTDLINKVKGKSTVAVLSAQRPIPFNGQKEFTRKKAFHCAPASE